MIQQEDSVAQGLKIQLNVTVSGNFLFRTDDTLSNPVVDVEILSVG